MSQNIENRSGDPRWDRPPAASDLYEPPTVKAIEKSTEKVQKTRPLTPEEEYVSETPEFKKMMKDFKMMWGG
jgi:hypothetical protein